jgi:predicted type IV restriction endonuclease
MTTVPSPVIELVETFDRNIDTYRSPQYNETQLRREFIDPFFEQLGWDVANKAGLAHAYKDVIHEDAISVGSATKAPDYCFRIGGTRKFFLEAKKPSINIKDDPHPAYQLRRYAWSAGLPLSILTDFEEFAVYDCQIKPNQKDGASVARIMYFTYKDYLHKWDRIAEIFSKDAILKGSFDKFAASPRKKRGTTTVDVVFLAEIEKWRDMLAKIIALRNTNLSQPEINFAVQCTIDRILFLRMCEDRGIERYGQLQSISSGDRTYPRLCEIFERADQKYNSGLFHFHLEPGRTTPPDTLTPSIAIDDKDLKWILYNLYYPQCPYEFSVLPPEILGNVYEQFLGKVITLTPAHHAKIEYKPEVKKAGGVYYTPSYIVDYIVKNTVGNLIEGKTPKQIENIKILDPACGSGSFLLGAYTCLLNYHRDWYVAHNGSKHSKEIYQGRGGHHFLTIAEKKRILLNNIFGVDIDSQAVEVTKLSLLLKVLEGENSQTLESQYRLFHERALPDLASNIKCGNSLIAPDFFDNAWQPQARPEQGRRTNLGDGAPSCHSRESGNPRVIPSEAEGNNQQRTTNNEQRTTNNKLYEKINPFDWKQEFPQIFARKNPGFDAVIGNPPYIQLSMADYYDEGVSAYLAQKYSSSMGRLNTFGLFIENALKSLIRGAGLLSLIVPNTLLTQESYQFLRQQILQERLVNLTSYDHPVFANAVVETVVFLVEKTTPHKNHVTVTQCDNKLMRYETQRIPQECYLKTHRNAFPVKINLPALQLMLTLDTRSPHLKNLVNINQAIALKYDRSQSLFKEPMGPNSRPVLDGRNIQRYALHWPGTYLAYDIKNIHSCKRTDIFETQEKILFRRVGSGLVATYDTHQFYALNTLVVITLRQTTSLSLKYILGLLNSRFLNFYYVTFLKSTKKIFSEIQARQLAELPIRTIDFDNPDDKAIHDKMVKLVERMLDLHKKLAAAKVPDEKTKIQRQIDTTDRQIDQLVYKLYNLTDEEIKIVEESTK